MIEQDHLGLPLDLEPVDLPAPAASAPRAPSLVLRAFVSVGLLVGLFVVAFGLVLGLVGLNLLLFQAGRVAGILVAATLAVVLSVGRGLLAMVRKPPEPEDEVEVPRADEPEVHERLRRLALAVGTRPPDRVVVTSEVNAYVREFGPLMGLVRGTRTLAIGTPLLDVLTVAQLDAVLAHELGHLAGGDTRLGPLAFKTDQAIAGMIQSLGGRALSSVFVGYWRFQHRVSAAVRRGQELVADRAAVTVGGRQAAADALWRIEITARAEDVYRQAYLAPLLQSGCRPADLASGLRELVADARRVAGLVDQASAQGQPTDPWASHPPTAERIARLAALSDPPWVEIDQRPARALWRDSDRWSRAAHETWLKLVVDPRTELRTVEWAQFGEETAGAIQRSRAVEVDQVLRRQGLAVGLDGLRAAISDGRGGSVAGDLIASGWRAPGVDERQEILVAAVTATATRAALDELGGRLRFSWSEPVVLADSQGRSISMDELARAAIPGDWAPLTTALTRPDHEAPISLAPSPVEAPNTGPSFTPEERVGAGPTPMVPQPPCPPFKPSSAGWLWEIDLPGRIGSRTTLAIGPDAVAFGTAVARYDDIQTVTIELRTGSDFRGTVKLGLSSGKAVKLSSSAMGNENKTAIRDAFEYLWGLLGVRAAPRLRAEIVAAIGRGAEVKVGNLTLSQAGITYRETRTHHVPWSRVVDTVLEGGVVHVLLARGKPITRPLSLDNAFLLADLIPELRARWG